MQVTEIDKASLNDALIAEITRLLDPFYFPDHDALASVVSMKGNRVLIVFNDDNQILGLATVRLASDFYCQKLLEIKYAYLGGDDPVKVAELIKNRAIELLAHGHPVRGSIQVPPSFIALGPQLVREGAVLRRGAYEFDLGENAALIVEDTAA